ncbi:caspase family protein [Myxococcus sp. MISCRS1]|uniref:caspase family protein n=1 Tax=Myxococcus TaxID=32 RepID=UPI001CBC2895|nr:caspase family protein [Myxococcus sp. MISCRS1]MBZ4398879.1 caspase family protein [Myxococcus sp. AS-1-15]MBZ4407141.1 caspase family protein [Myxococcus sp. XM-1-1-1]MCY1002341.1 caspase family protein [Myxococcus sp. MISCRS1]BDT36091.1 caspase family protein [Myxococcus sp. MH1]
MRPLLSILLAALMACATPSSLGTEKGGLVPLRLDEEALSSAYTPRRMALLVGISEFDDPHWRGLRYPSKDAKDLAAAMLDPTKGRFDQVRVLTRPEETTRAAILAALRQLRKEAHRPDDVVVVYFSAHGTLARDATGELRRFLVTRDASYRAIAQTALSMDALKAEFDALSSRRRLLVLASCHSGNGKSLLPKELEKELSGIKSGFYARPLEESSRASMVFAACDWGETAREDEGLQNDIYTHFLVEGLGGGADRNADGAVTATEAHDYARRRTFAFTEGRQRPSAEILEVGADPVVLSGSISRTGRPELFSYNPRLDGFTLKVDGEPRTELPGGAAVVPGKRTVELTKGDAVLVRREVEVGDGERLPLEQLLSEAFPRRSLSLLGGMFTFADARSRGELLPMAPEVAVSLRLEDRPLRDFGLLFDVSFSTGRRSLRLLPEDTVPFRYTTFSAGVALPYLWRWERLTLFAGPRVATLYLGRSFDVETYAAGQSFFTVSPGVVGGVVLRVGERLELVGQAQLMLTYVVLDGKGQAVGFTGGWAGVGYRF